MYGYVESAITSAVASFGSGLVSFVAAPLGVAATIYFLLLGFAVLRGAIQAPCASWYSKPARSASR
jgi:type IV secretion system protein VirB6